jgi:hypothetical protein
VTADYAGNSCLLISWVDRGACSLDKKYYIVAKRRQADGSCRLMNELMVTGTNQFSYCNIPDSNCAKFEVRIFGCPTGSAAGATCGATTAVISGESQFSL